MTIATVNQFRIILHLVFVRAGDGVRTRDMQLGKLPLYQLSYARETLNTL